MPYRVAETVLNASTIDILNVIRENATYEYQTLVPEVTQQLDIPKVGEVLYGHPALANQFINALVNRIAAVRIKSANFNNPYKDLKKGYLQFGETVEEVYVQIAKARIFSAEKAAGREFKRTLPIVRSAFHMINWRVQYPITVQNEDLRMAFTSLNGVEDLIARIIQQVYTAAEYDEFLLFKYLLIKGVAKGQLYPVGFDATNKNNAAVEFRAMSNMLPFMKKDYNAAKVETTTPKADQYIFMDARFNADYDVNVLASAFNMDKADFMGRLKLIDDWTTFDNERFDEVRKESDGLEEVTAAELALMKDVKAILIDAEWFQVYDNLDQMTEKYVASGMYWNYFYNTWKTVSTSPFANAVVFVANGATEEMPATLNVKVTEKSVGEEGTVLVLTPDMTSTKIRDNNYEFVQTQACVEAGIGVQKYGAILLPPNVTATKITFIAGGKAYTSDAAIAGTEAVGATVQFTAA